MLALSAGPLAGTAAAAPTYTVAPLITDNAVVGKTLTLTQANWPAGTVITDRLLRCDSMGNGCSDAGIIAGTYVMTTADAGMVLEAQETAADGTGNTVVRYSNQTPPVAAAAPAPAPTSQNPPTIPGTASAQRGQLLTESHGSTTSAAPTVSSYSYQWKRCNTMGSICANIVGATDSTYTPGVQDEGFSLEIQETPVSGTVALTPTSSAPTAAVVPAPAVNSGLPPTISGTPVQGQTLTASPGGWTNSPTSYNYQWLDCDSAGQNCVAISGANGATYVLTAGDVSDTIVVSVSGVNPDGAGAAAASAPTSTVQTASTVSLTTAPSAPVTNQGVTLAATVTSRAAAGAPSGSVAFTNAGKPISGCSAVPVAPSGQSVTVLCQTSFGAGSPQLTATFTPDAASVVLGSSSSGQTLTVGKDTATTALDASAQVQVNATTTYTATVAPNAARSGPIQPSGDVEFLDGGQPIPDCSSQRLVNGGATCTIRYADTGSRSITARYLGDANFLGSSSAATASHVVALPNKGTITATMQWTFAFAPTYTRVLSMAINGVPTGASVQIACHGRGCPFAKRNTTIGKPKPCTGKAKRTHSCPVHGRISLTTTLQRRHLRPGAQITIEIRRPRYVGKYYSFTMLSRKQPRVKIGCLAIDGTRPNVGC